MVSQEPDEAADARVFVAITGVDEFGVQYVEITGPTIDKFFAVYDAAMSLMNVELHWDETEWNRALDILRSACRRVKEWR